MSQAKCGFEDGRVGLGRNLLVRFGPTLNVHIGFDPGYDVRNPDRLAALQMMDARALVDTGASISCIDAGLAMDLQLPIIDQTSVAGVGGLHQFNMHLAQIRAPALKFTFFGEFAGVDLAAGGQGHTVLIGRDFLSHFHMTYDGPSGAVVLTDPSAPMDVAAWDEE